MVPPTPAASQAGLLRSAECVALENRRLPSIGDRFVNNGTHDMDSLVTKESQSGMYRVDQDRTNVKKHFAWVYLGMTP